jgi:hypothetical protein
VTVYPVIFTQPYGGVSAALNYNPNEVAAFMANQAVYLVALGVATFVNPADQTAFAAQVAAAQGRLPGLFPSS